MVHFGVGDLSLVGTELTRSSNFWRYVQLLRARFRTALESERCRLPQDVGHFPEGNNLGAFVTPETQQMMFVSGHKIIR